MKTGRTDKNQEIIDLIDEIPGTLTEPELLNKTLLPWLQTKEIIKTKFYLLKLLINMKVNLLREFEHFILSQC